MPDVHDPALLAEDDAARVRALDPAVSFLVQAPAGSGKTELLIQRFLALLPLVAEPERIVALTFTRKAAGEMRERIVRAMLGARTGTPVERPHEQRTRELALAALAHSDRLGWSLTEHPARLAIYTFDALATAIARRAPIAAGLGPAPGYLDDASVLHRTAASEAIAEADPTDAHWRCLMRHLDNDAALAADLIARLLQRRDQWLRQVAFDDAARLRAELETALAAEAADVLAATRRAFPGDAPARIAALARTASGWLADHANEARRALSAELTHCADCGGLPVATPEALPHWRALAQWLLVADGSHFRRAINKNDGFPAGSKGDEGKARDAAKLAMRALCAQLDATPGLAAALYAASRLPSPSIGEAAWAVVEALQHVLRQAVGQLTLAFAEEGAVDYVQGNLAALAALGSPEEPTDLLLRIDARIDHLLLDEFQDTSFTQLELLGRLTAGWLGDAGRTIFAVGDPMQSIYRFREAEVRLVVEAQQSGTIARLPVERLTLRKNFRAQANLVAWVNERFPSVLGRVSDPARGGVKFAAAASAKDPLEGIVPTLDLCATPEAEAACVVARVNAARAADAKDIAILVRARSHLALVLPALRDAGIAFAGVDLDTLAQRQAILDLTALTHALVQPADRTAWLAVLRAPWCGLALADLFAVVHAAGAERDAPLSRVLEPDADLDRVSADGRARLARLAGALRPAIASRGSASLAARVRGAWLALGGPACLDDALDVATAGKFFAELARQERGGDLPDRAAFARSLDVLFASPERPDADVQVMTMHKAKGLEFDTVILPGLARVGNKGDPPLLRWRRRERGLLIAPARARGGEEDPVYAYLGDLDAEEAHAELGRLLYVACTRARSRLHLVAAPGLQEDRQGDIVWKNPVRGSSLARLWPALESMAGLPSTDAGMPAAAGTAPPSLLRLRPDFTVAVPADPLQPRADDVGRNEDALPFDWAAETARQIGVLAHRLLARIAGEGTDAWPQSRIAALAHRVHADLTSAGFTPDEATAASAKVLAAVGRTLTDSRGRWLFAPGHQDSRSEWALAGLDEDAVEHVVIDRTFVADGVRWIVDFKTGTHEGGDVAGFLDREQERYRPQLERYGRLLRALDARPIRLALYYPLVPDGFREWPYSG